MSDREFISIVTTDHGLAIVFSDYEAFDAFDDYLTDLLTEEEVYKLSFVFEEARWLIYFDYDNPKPVAEIEQLVAAYLEAQKAVEEGGDKPAG